MAYILKTERLILRHLTFDDASFLIELMNSPGWLKFIGDRNVHTEQQARDYLQNGPMKSYLENGYGLAMVEAQKGNIPVGMCGLIKRDHLEDPDIGFAFLPEHTAKGYATEMAKAVLAHAEKVLGLKAISAITLPTNHASINLLKKAGFVFAKMYSMPNASEELMLFNYNIKDSL